MKFKCIATIALAVGLVFIASCGTNLSGGVTLTQARSTCIEWATGTPVPELGTTTLIDIAQARRDAGESEADWLLDLSQDCNDEKQNNHDTPGCIACITQIGSAVWK